MREGTSAKEAERQARVAFGNPTLFEERSREVWQWPTLESIWADLRFSIRQLRRSRGITIATVLPLALAIGANAIVFGLMDGLILRPLNYPSPSASMEPTTATIPPGSRIPTILNSGIVTTASKIWQHSTWSWASV
jgi:hypothetical protein